MPAPGVPMQAASILTFKPAAPADPFGGMKPPSQPIQPPPVRTAAAADPFASMAAQSMNT